MDISSFAAAAAALVDTIEKLTESVAYLQEKVTDLEEKLEDRDNKLDELDEKIISEYDLDDKVQEIIRNMTFTVSVD